MTNAEKLAAAREHFRALGINPNLGAPPIVRMFWLVRIPVPPLVFLRFGTIAIITGGFFAVFWGLFMWVFFWSGPGTSRWVAFGVPVLAGAAFGWYNAARMREAARKLGLPLWTQYNGEAPTLRRETTQPGMGIAAGPGAGQTGFTRIAACPHCGGSIRLGLFSLVPRRFVAPSVTCPHCHKRCTLRLRLRIIATICGFVSCMAIIAMTIVLMLVTNTDNQIVLYISPIIGVMAWMAVQISIYFKYGVLVEARSP